MTDQQKPTYLIVHTAHQFPTWVPWVTYAMIFVNLWLINAGLYGMWPVYGLAAMAAAMTYSFFVVYAAFVNMFNQLRIDSAIRQQRRKEMHTHTDMVKATPDDDVLLTRYRCALEYINQIAKEIGEARDTAWRALEHDHIQANIKEHGDDKAKT